MTHAEQISTLRRRPRLPSRPIYTHGSSTRRIRTVRPARHKPPNVLPQNDRRCMEQDKLCPRRIGKPRRGRKCACRISTTRMSHHWLTINGPHEQPATIDAVDTYKPSNRWIIHNLESDSGQITRSSAPHFRWLLREMEHILWHLFLNNR